MKTASASTIQKWPEKLPLSPGQTERTPGLVTSELECDKLSVISGLFQPGLGKAEQKQSGVTLTTS